AGMPFRRLSAAGIAPRMASLVEVSPAAGRFSATAISVTKKPAVSSRTIRSKKLILASIRDLYPMCLLQRSHAGSVHNAAVAGKETGHFHCHRFQHWLQ